MTHLPTTSWHLGRYLVNLLRSIHLLPLPRCFEEVMMAPLPHLLFAIALWGCWMNGLSLSASRTPPYFKAKSTSTTSSSNSRSNTRLSGVGLDKDNTVTSSTAPDFEGKIGEQRREVISTMFKEGKSIQYGVLQADVDPSTIPSDKERKERIAKATKDLVNIDDAERGRRKKIGLCGAALSSAVYAGRCLHWLKDIIY